MGIVAVWAVITIRGRASELDKAFLPLGLQGRGYLINGRQYHGRFRGYAVHVYFYRGPTLQIYLDLPLGTRLGIGRQGAISQFAADLMDKKALSVDDPAFDHLVIYPVDYEWAGEFLADHQARAAILRLTDEDTAAELRALSITPNALLWQSHYNTVRNIHPESVRAWIDDLYELARIAQGLRSPRVTAVESDLERASRADRGKFTWPVLGVTCGIIAAMAACIIAISAVVIILMESGL
jgi:hypothetical protein